MQRASYPRYNEPGGPSHRASCWLYVVDEKGIQHHAIPKGVMADSEYQLLRIILLVQLARQFFHTYLYMEISTDT